MKVENDIYEREDSQENKYLIFSVGEENYGIKGKEDKISINY